MSTRRPWPPATDDQLAAAMRLLVMAARADGEASDEQRARALLDRTTDRTVLTLAKQHGAGGLLFDLLRRLAVDRPGLTPRLRGRYVEAVRRHMRAIADLVSLARVLHGIEDWGVLKGPVLVEEAYDRQPGLRGYYDIDLLVRPRAFGDAVAALEGAGAAVVDRNWRMLRRDLRGEVLIRLSGGTAVDLHWHLINMYRRRTRMDPAEIAERMRPISIGAASVRTLDREDGLIHLALHAALSGADRLSWLTDLDRAARAWQPDWEVVFERSHRWRIAPAVGLMLHRSREVVGAPVPPELTSRLMGQRIAAVAATIDRRWPWAYGMGRTTSPSRIFARSVVHGLADGAAWIAWRSIRNLDPRQEARSSAFREQGDESDRRRFLEAVGATDPLADGRR